MSASKESLHFAELAPAGGVADAGGVAVPGVPVEFTVTWGGVDAAAAAVCAEDPPAGADAAGSIADAGAALVVVAGAVSIFYSFRVKSQSSSGLRFKYF